MPHRSQTIPEIFQRLADLRERLPEERSKPLPPDSTWLFPASNDERLIWALDQAGAILCELDQQSRILWVSPNVERITGHQPDEFRGLYVGEHVHPEDLERLVDVSRAMSDGSAPERARLRTRHKDGSWVHLEAISAARFRASDGSIHSVSVLCDVTERQEAWAALRASEERYRVIIEASRDAVAEVDEELQHTFDLGIEEVTGFTSEEFSQLQAFDLVHPDDRERVEKTLRRSFISGKTVEIEPFRMRRKEGRYVWYECTGVTYRCADGGLRFLTVGRDVSARRRQEEEQHALELKMQQAQRLESLGVLAGGIAHDFNNLLTPILGEARLALGDLPEDSPQRERFERIQRAARRAAELTQQMLAYAGAEAPKARPLDLGELVGDMAELMKGAASSNLKLHYEIGTPGLRVEGDPAQIGQVVMNLVTNAAEAVGDASGDVTVRTGEIELREPQASGAADLLDPLAPGHYVFFEVEDTGCGMNEATRSRIFDPFFTTKFTGRGLGLAAVLGIVRAHEGGIEIETEPKRGTRFRILIPRLKRPATRR